MKTEYIQIRVTEDFKEEVKKKADMLNMSISQYIIYSINKEMGRV